MINNSPKTNSWKTIALFIVTFLFITGFLQYIGIYALKIESTISDARTIEQQVIISFIGLIGAIITVYVFTKFLEKETFSNIGLSFKHRLKDIKIGTIIGFLFIAGGYLILLFLNQIVFKKIELNVKELFLSFFLFAIIAIGEEIVFRGYILRSLLKLHGRKISLVISAVLFSVMHVLNPNMGWITFINLFLAGIVLGLPYVLTKNLWLSIALHFSWNFFQSFFGFNVSGQNSFSVINTDIVKNNILNGGEFGFEGSILCIFAQIIIIAFINYGYGNKRFTFPL